MTSETHWQSPEKLATIALIQKHVNKLGCPFNPTLILWIICCSKPTYISLRQLTMIKKLFLPPI